MERIEELLEYETAGDPVSGLKWTRKTTEKIALELGNLNIRISSNTVAKLLKEMGFSLRVNQKKRAVSSVSPQVRDEQIVYINEQRAGFSSRGAMVISVDTKKKELVGHFKNDGQAWSREPVVVKDHDFRSQAEGLAIPYGIYDLRANRGAV
ncbi:MAG: ISAzo13 family transposase, partial [Bacillota bacterium]